MSNIPNPLDDSNAHQYIPNSSEDVAQMLRTIGIDSIDKLFETIPDDV